MENRTATLVPSAGSRRFTVDLEPLLKLSPHMNETYEEFGDEDELDYRIDIINATDRSVEIVVEYINSCTFEDTGVDMSEPLEKPLRGTLESQLLPFEQEVVNRIEKDAGLLNNLINTLDFLNMPRFFSISLCILGLAVDEAERLKKAGRDYDSKFLDDFKAIAGPVPQE